MKELLNIFDHITKK